MRFYINTYVLVRVIHVKMFRQNAALVIYEPGRPAERSQTSTASFHLAQCVLKYAKEIIFTSSPIAENTPTPGPGHFHCTTMKRKKKAPELSPPDVCRCQIPPLRGFQMFPPTPTAGRQFHRGTYDILHYQYEPLFIRDIHTAEPQSDPPAAEQLGLSALLEGGSERGRVSLKLQSFSHKLAPQRPSLKPRQQLGGDLIVGVTYLLDHMRILRGRPPSARCAAWTCVSDSDVKGSEVGDILYYSVTCKFNEKTKTSDELIYWRLLSVCVDLINLLSPLCFRDPSGIHQGAIREPHLGTACSFSPN